MQRTLGWARTERALPREVDPDEYNRGRPIGVIERLILAWLVVAGSYAAMGFIIVMAKDDAWRC